VVLSTLCLLIKCVSGVHFLVWLPSVEAIDLIESYAEGCSLIFKKLDRFKSLLLQAVHNVDNENCHIAEAGTSGT